MLHVWNAKIDGKVNMVLGGGNSNIFHFHPRKLGKISNLTYLYFSNGLVQPPASNSWWSRGGCGAGGVLWPSERPKAHHLLGNGQVKCSNSVYTSRLGRKYHLTTATPCRWYHPTWSPRTCMVSNFKQIFGCLWDISIFWEVFIWIKFHVLLILGVVFRYCLFSPRKLGKISNSTSIFFRWVGEKPPTSLEDGMGHLSNGMDVARIPFVAEERRTNDLKWISQMSNPEPIASMGLVYLTTFTIFTIKNNRNQPNVGKYTIHGWYGKWF